MYQTFIQITKYGFGTVLILASFYTFFVSYKEKRSYRFLFQWFSLTGYALLFCGITLILVTGFADQDQALILIRAISTAFALIYGIYATITGFHETDAATGRKVLTKFGIMGLMILCFNTVFSTAIDYTKAALELEERANGEKARKEEYQKLIGSMGFMDQKAGSLQIDFRKFSQDLYKTLISTENELNAKRTDLASRETELKETRSRLSDSENEKKQLRERLEKSESALAGRESDLKSREADLKGKDADLKSKDQDLKNKDQDLKNKDSELKNANALAATLSESLKKTQEEWSRLGKDLQAKDIESKDWLKKSIEFETLLKQAQADQKKTELALNARETETTDLKAKLSVSDALLRKETEDRIKMERLFAARGAELRACRVPEKADKTETP